jgi:hypothetical protein
MPARGRGQYQRAGTSRTRRRFNVLKAVRTSRGQAGVNWSQYLQTTQNGRKEYTSKKKR